jgi:transglutaminase-like putative cysteine protease
MRFEIQHTTTYRYSAPVQLGPHTVRLLPRSDGGQRLQDYHCRVRPQPELQTNVLDAEGNTVTRLWFTGATDELRIETSCRVVTFRNNPHDYIVDTPATRLPPAYDPSETALLGSYLQPRSPSPELLELAARLARQSGHDTLAFLQILNGFLHTRIERIIRDHGAPQSPDDTLRSRRGACRDLATLFMDVCRSQGIAARFVSGYQARTQPGRKQRYLHAWPEVYIPGGGWRGYDPTHGTAVAAEHVALAAAGTAAGTLPVEGCFYGDDVRSEMEFELCIRTEA